MKLHLVEIAATVAPGAQAGWHLSMGLVVPPNITIMALRPEMSRAQSGRKRLAVPA
jgi:hypothetical protein